MSEKNRKFEMTMHGRIRKTPIRKKKKEEQKAPPIPGFENITPEMMQALMQLIEAQRSQQAPAAPAYPQYPQYPVFPSPYEYPNTVPAVWYGDPNGGLRWNNGTGIVGNGFAGDVQRSGLSLTGDAITGGSFTVSSTGAGDIVQAQGISGSMQNTGIVQGSGDHVTLTAPIIAISNGYRQSKSARINILQN